PAQHPHRDAEPAAGGIGARVELRGAGRGALEHHAPHQERPMGRPLLHAESVYSFFAGMIDLRPYEKLHTIQMLKDVIRKWWGVELAFADAKGYVLDHAEGKIIPPNNDFCRIALFSKDGFRRCHESVKSVRDKLRATVRGRRCIVHECHLGFDLVAC